MSSSGQGRDLASIVGSNLRQAREDADLTQRELALRVGGKTDGQSVSDWERGQHRPSDANMQKLAEILHRPLAWFYGEHDEVAA